MKTGNEEKGGRRKRRRRRRLRERRQRETTCSFSSLCLSLHHLLFLAIIIVPSHAPDRDRAHAREQLWVVIIGKCKRV